MKKNSNSGILELLANAHSISSFQGTRYFFNGNLCQMSTAQQVAYQLSIRTGIERGIPFVMSEDDFNKVKQYLIEHQIDGWWHYVTNKQYHELKAKVSSE